MTITVKASEAVDIMTNAIKAGIVPNIEGSPGCGKSALVHQIAEDYNLELIDLRLAQCDPTDLLGFPDIDRAKGRAGYMPMETFPLEGDIVPEGKNGWLLFLDEFNSADRSVQKAAYKLVLDRKIGARNLAKNCAIICAGNLLTDNAIVEEMSTALQSRMIHLQLEVDHKEWLKWAGEKGINPRITGFINFKPGNLYSFNPDHEDKTYAAPRTWEFTHRLIETVGEDYEHMMPMLAGTVSEGIAREFMAFMKIYADLPTIQQIMAQPGTIPVPNEPSILFALTSSIAHNITDKTAGPIVQYVERLPREFQVVSMREAITRNNELLDVKEVADWLNTNAEDLF